MSLEVTCHVCMFILIAHKWNNSAKPWSDDTKSAVQWSWGTDSKITCLGRWHARGANWQIIGQRFQGNHQPAQIHQSLRS